MENQQTRVRVRTTMADAYRKRHGDDALDAMLSDIRQDYRDGALVSVEMVMHEGRDEMGQCDYYAVTLLLRPIPFIVPTFPNAEILP